MFIDSDGSVTIDGASVAAIDGKYGRLYNAGGKLRLSSTATVGANVAGGPDMYIGPASELHIVGDYVKTAVNTVASPVLLALNLKSITQTVGALFTVFTPAGAPGDWVTGYGATGAIDISGNARPQLGVLTGGAAATTSQACTLRNNVQLIHEGAGLDGAGPLVLGGSAAAAWPAGITSDALAGTPENCWIFPI
ncbi:MAG: hypothetical protein ABIF77_13345 [bacterium]